MKTLLLSMLLLMSGLVSMAQNVNIPDANFKAALVADVTLVNTNGDNEIQLSEARAAIGIVAANASITDLTGIEEFTALSQVFLQGNSISSIDLSNSPSLEIVWVNDNPLTNLVLPNTSTLEELHCYNTQLTTLNLPSAGTNLEKLRCENTPIATINFPSSISNLRHLQCHHTQLTNLDLSGASSLNTFNGSYSQLSQLQFPSTVGAGPNGKVEWDCSHNQLVNFMPPAASTFTYLDCSNNQLDTLILTGGQGGTSSTVYCDSNQINYLEIGQAVDSLYCGYNNLTNLFVSGLSDLQLLHANNNNITDVLWQNSLVKDVNLRNNNITQLYFNSSLTNINGSRFEARGNANLWCIAFNRIADANYARVNWTNVDNTGANGVTYTNQSTCFPIWTDVNEIEEAFKPTIYPNPTTGQVQLDLNQWNKEITLQIYNSTGQLLQEQQVQQVQQHSFTLPETNGLYWIRIQTLQNQHSFPVLKQ